MKETQDRRGRDRLLCAELVELSWFDQLGRPQRRVANLEDISLCGVCLQVESPIPTGTALSVSYGDGELFGAVRYCRYEGLGYFLGVQLAEGCRWSSQHYRPEHLLDPRDLVDNAVLRFQSNLAVRPS